MLQLPSTDLINRLQPKAPSETRAIEEIAQLSRDQNVKIKDCVDVSRECYTAKL